MSQLNDADVARLKKLAGMLGSSHDGEVLAAARKATEFLKSRNLTWADVIAADQPKAPDVKFQQRWSPGPDIEQQMREFAERMGGFGEVVRKAMRQAEEQMNAQSGERGKVAEARIALDMVLARKNLDQRKREHFESIRSYHQENGYINPAHRSQIMREYFKNGWDSPLDAEPRPDPNERVNIQVDSQGRKYFMRDGVRQYLGSLEG